MNTNKSLNVLRVVIGLNQGGVQQGVLNLCRSVDPKRYKIIACAIENGGAIASEIEKTGSEVIILGHKREPSKTIPTLVKLMRDRKIDIVHASSYHPSLYARVSAILARVPIIISYEHVVFSRNRFWRKIINYFLQYYTHAYTAVGEAVADQVQRWYRYPHDKLHVIHNGVDIDRFRPPNDRFAAKKSLGLDSKRSVVSMICRLDEEKGHQYLFHAIKSLSNAKDIQWLIVGSGRAEAKIKSQADSIGISQHLKFLGMRRDIPEILAASDIYAFPTLQEGFPNSLLEAMAAGCAVVASDFSGNLEVAQHEHNALITPMRDGQAVADAISRLLDDQVLANRLAHQARIDIEQGFSLSAYGRKMSFLYDALWQQYLK
jgi:glycosyltransferase involved in cell wall biosynthesis